MKFKTTLKLQIPIKPAEVAQLFCNMDNYEQAEFFNACAEIMKTWTHSPAVQFQKITNTTSLTDDARTVMRTIGEYSIR